jgi:hypothetical protein
MILPSLSNSDLIRILSGEAAHVDVLKGHRQAEIIRLAEGLPLADLTIKASAVTRVLTDLGHMKIAAEQAQAWASFVRRGYISTDNEPVQPIDVPYQADREEAIGEAISRLDELGDLIDGTISDDELQHLIETLK